MTGLTPAAAEARFARAAHDPALPAMSRDAALACRAGARRGAA